jgi:hypothetical protein
LLPGRVYVYDSQFARMNVLDESPVLKHWIESMLKPYIP